MQILSLRPRIFTNKIWIENWWPSQFPVFESCQTPTFYKAIFKLSFLIIFPSCEIWQLSKNSCVFRGKKLQEVLGSAPENSTRTALIICRILKVRPHPRWAFIRPQECRPFLLPSTPGWSTAWASCPFREATPATWKTSPPGQTVSNRSNHLPTSSRSCQPPHRY